ncbi:MAG TPA: carboxylating nicotinate-nucleotide diphosphorylase [Bacillota bacterium]|nr:carboxylating nicotinate-nucleotide diphosphorylase [Bacillota bacterium]
MLTRHFIKAVVTMALEEDLKYGDVTTEAIVSPQATGVGCIYAREKGVIAGLPLAECAFMELDDNLECTRLVEEGAHVEAGQPLMRVCGRLRALLSAERTALNFLQRLSGIATMTAAWVKELEGYPARLADTRKTTPGLRVLEKYAVRVGGGVNHRFSLGSGILIKDNHISAAGGIAAAVSAVRQRASFIWRIEVEVTTLEELEEALAAGAELILLDNMDTPTIRKAVEITAGRALLEASGNIGFERLREIAATGVDYISCGALTHSYRALDIHMSLENEADT